MSAFRRWLAPVLVVALTTVAAAAPINYFNQLYTGPRDDYNGQVGFEFVASSGFYVASLGRAVNPAYNSGNLQRDHVVRLWDVATQAKLAEVTITNSSPRDALGYAYAPLTQLVPLTPGRKYVVATAEYGGSGDPWFSPGVPGHVYPTNYHNELGTFTYDAYVGNYTAYPGSRGWPLTGYGLPTFYANTDVGQNFFKGLYTGTRDDYSGQVGAEFQAFKDFTLKSLGRAVNPSYNGGKLLTAHTLRLWDIATQQKLGEVVVDGNSLYETGGYVIGMLSSPITIKAGQRFVVTSTETANSGDPWYNAGQQGTPGLDNHLNVATVRADAYGNATSFPGSHNWGGDGYGGPTFFGDLLPEKAPGLNLFTDEYVGRRNNFDGAVGFRFVPKSDAEVERLGRAVSPIYPGDGTLLRDGLVASHLLELWREDSPTTGTLLASVNVGPSSPRDEMGFAFAYLPSDIQLIAGQAYRLVSMEYATGNSGDPWRDWFTALNYNRDLFQITNGCYRAGASGFPGENGYSTDYTCGGVTLYISPEPCTLALLGLGSLALAGSRRRRR